jgi:hypothetical protein
MRKITSLLGVGLLLGCLLSVKTKASIIPNDRTYWDYWYTGTTTPTPTGPNKWDWNKQVDIGFGQPYWVDNPNLPPTLFIPNRPNDVKYKIVCLELDYWQNPTVPPSQLPPLLQAVGTAGLNYTVNLIEGPVYGTANDVTFRWNIIPQPGAETIQFDPSWLVGLRQIDIATKCVPEPSTYLAGLSALGMLGLFGWRNRK